MSTNTVNWNDANVLYYGFWQHLLNGASDGGHANYNRAYGLYSGVVVPFAGDGIAMNCRIGIDSGASVYQYQIDGGAWTTIANATAWSTTKINLTGLSEGQHILHIRMMTSADGGAAYFYVPTDVAPWTITYTSASGTTFALTTLATTLYKSAPQNSWMAGSIYLMASALQSLGGIFQETTTGTPSSSYLTVEDGDTTVGGFAGGNWSLQTAGGGSWIGVPTAPTDGGGNAKQVANGCTLRFTGSFSAPGEIWILAEIAAAFAFTARIGDTTMGFGEVYPYPSDLSGVAGELVWIKVAEQLNQAEYPIEIQISNNYSYIQGNIHAISIVGGTMISTPPATRSSMAIFGDSFSQGNVYGFNDTCFPKLSAASLQLACINRGLSGTSIRDYSGVAGYTGGTYGGFSTLAFKNRVSQITAISPAPHIVVIAGGTNDLFCATEDSGTSGIYIGITDGAMVGGHTVNTTPADFQADYTYLVTQIKTAFPNAKILCLSIPPKYTDSTQFNSNGQFNSYWRGLLNQAIAAAAATAPNGVYVDVNNGPLGAIVANTAGTADTLGDGWHLNASGNAKYRAAIVAVASPPNSVVRVGMGGGISG